MTHDMVMTAPKGKTEIFDTLTQGDEVKIVTRHGEATFILKSTWKSSADLGTQIRLKERK